MLSDYGPGFPFFLPNGMILRNELINYWREVHRKYNYYEVSTPMIMNRQLWETSGHWDHYKEICTSRRLTAKIMPSNR